MLSILPIFAVADSACAKHFFGLIPWYQYLNVSAKQHCEIQDFNILPRTNNPSDVPLVLAAIADDLLRIAGMVAVAFVIVGAIQYITSQGNPEDTAKAQSTIINALIGLAIATLSVVFISFVGTELGS
jgi:hypothetical protein